MFQMPAKIRISILFYFSFALKMLDPRGKNVMRRAATIRLRFSVSDKIFDVLHEIDSGQIILCLFTHNIRLLLRKEFLIKQKVYD